MTPRRGKSVTCGSGADVIPRALDFYSFMVEQLASGNLPTPEQFAALPEAFQRDLGDVYAERLRRQLGMGDDPFAWLREHPPFG